jgi:LysM repeat protein
LWIESFGEAKMSLKDIQFFVRSLRMNKRIQPVQNAGLIAKAFSILIVLALLVSVVPQPVQAAPTATCSKMYTVATGDTLSKIALQFNVTEQALAAANNLKEPYVIVVGQSLCIPGTTTTGGTTSSGSTSTAPDFTVTRDGNRIVVKLVNLTPKRPYGVRIGPDIRTSTNRMRIGNVRTNKVGVGERSFQLPRDYRNRTNYGMCLKDQITDAVMCKTIKQ